MNIYFYHAQKNPTEQKPVIEYGMNSIHITSRVPACPQGHAKIFDYMSYYSWKLMNVHFLLFNAIFLQP